MTKRQSAKELRAIVDTIKLTMGCELCGYNKCARVLQFDHIEPLHKYRTANDKVVHLSDMVTKRYALITILNEISKCRVLCANCHLEYTYNEQRKES